MNSPSVQLLIEPYVNRIGGLMHALRHIQQEQGYIDPSQVPEIADVFNISQAEVRGVISFYHDFRTSPPPRHIIRLCQAEACQAQGSRQLARQVEDHFGTKIGERACEDNVELQAVYCLGLCSVGPSLMIDGQIVARATLDSVRGIPE